jgi:dTDP-4-amino-4,6-dideoxygalactose transaminase
MTTGGEGGMVTCNDESFGTNWRLTGMQSAIGRMQLSGIPEWFKLRVKYVDFIASTCSKFECIRVPNVPEYVEHAN